MSISILKNGRFSSSSSGSSGTYDGEKIPGDLSAWNVLSSDANKKFYNTYSLLAERSGSLYQTYGPAKSAVDKQVDYAIGSGLIFRSQPEWNMIPNFDRASANDWAKEAQPIIDYYFHKYNFYEKQAVLMRTSLIYGDSLLFMLRDEMGMLADMIEFNGNYINSKYDKAYSSDTGYGYTLGIKHDKYLRKMGIMGANGDESLFKDDEGRANFVQFMIKNEARQLRGIPLTSAIINLAKNDDRHHDAIVSRAVLESIILGNFKSDNEDPTRQTRLAASRNVAKIKGVPANKNFVEKIAGAFKLGAGNVYRVGSDEGGMEFTKLETPSNNFGEFKTWMINYIGAATGTPAQVILSKYDTSYTSHKGAFNDFKKAYMYKRERFQETVMQSTVDACLSDAIDNGLISAPGFYSNPMIRYAYSKGSYLGPVPGAINPLQEANANEKNVKNAFVKRADISSQFGNNFNNFIADWGEQEQEYYSLSPEKQLEREEAQLRNNGDNNNGNS